MAPRHVDPTDRLLDWRHLQAIPRRTAIDDLARQSGHLRDIQHHTRQGDSRYSGLRWYFPRPFLHLRFCRLLLLQSALFLPPGDFALFMIRLIHRLPALLSFHCSLQLFMGLLDRSQQRQDQPTVWRHTWNGNGYPNL
jgi:hypothetical protein